MPSKTRPKLQRIGSAMEERGIRTVGTILQEKGVKTLRGKTLKEKQQANGRTLALDGAAWRKLRAAVLTEQPMCPECRDQGLLVPATEVDHHDNDPSNNSRENLVGLCKPHHSQKTAREMHGHRARPHGCDVDGIPLDPDHPWRMMVRQLSEKSPATDSHKPLGSPRVIAKSNEP